MRRLVDAGLGRHSQPVEPGEALQIVGEAGEAELGRVAGHADRADDEAQALLLAGEHVLDRGPDLAAAGVAAPDVRSHRLAARLRPMQVGAMARLASTARLAAER